MALTSAVYQFGAFRLDVTERLLMRSGKPLGLTPKAFDLLVYLVEHEGRLLTKQELMDALWPSTFVEEANLAYTVSALRKALADGQNGQHFIHTVPTRGYRFVAHVTTEGTSEVSNAPPTSAPTRDTVQRRQMPRVMGMLLLASLGAAVLLAFGAFRERDAPGPATRLTFPLPDTNMVTYGVPVPQISPDGRRVALLVSAGSGVWLRDLAGDSTSHPLAGTENARSLFWSPDSTHLAFVTFTAVKTVRVSDGAVEVLCDTCDPAGGGSWSRTGRIVFPSRQGPLHSIAPGAGQADVLTRLDRHAGEVAHLAPSFLPDGQHFLYVVRTADARRSALYVARVDSADRRVLLAGEAFAIFAAPGYLLFVGSGGIMARPFDPVRLEFEGVAQRLVRAEFLRNDLGGQPAFSASETGVLTYAATERPRTHFQWFARNGSPGEMVGQPGMHYTFDLSDDGKRLVYGKVEPGNTHLWVLDLDATVVSPITSGTGSYADPRWAAGGIVVATRWRPLPPAIVRIAPDGTESVIVSTRDAMMVDDVGGDNSLLLYRNPIGHLLATSVFGDTAPVLVRAAPSGRINQGRLSPDGRWVAYQEADLEGRFDVHVAPFPPTGERWQVSVAGAVQPLWRADSRELYFLALDGTLTAVTRRPGERRPFSPPKTLFTTGLLPPAPSVEEYAVSDAGRRFLLLRPTGDHVRSSIGVIANWRSLLNASPAAQ